MYDKFISRLFKIECSISLSRLHCVKQYSHDNACWRQTLSLASCAILIASFNAVKASSLQKQNTTYCKIFIFAC